MNYPLALAIGACVAVLPTVGCTQGKQASYGSIQARNVFDLSEPKSAVVLGKTPPAEVAPAIKLAGLMTIQSQKRAMLSVPTPSGKSLSLSLREGERNGDITVEKIDMASGEVFIQYRGEPMTLGFITHGVARSQGDTPKRL